MIKGGSKFVGEKMRNLKEKIKRDQILMKSNPAQSVIYEEEILIITEEIEYITEYYTSEEYHTVRRQIKKGSVTRKPAPKPTPARINKANQIR